MQDRSEASRAAPGPWLSPWAIVGAAGVAITQPILDLLGAHPQFFVAGHYTSGQILAVGLLVAVVPSVVLVALVAAGRAVRPTIGVAIHRTALVLLGALFGNVLLRGVGVDRLGGAVVAAVVGGAAGLALSRGRGGRLLLQYLAAANAVFLVGFLLVSPTSDLLSQEAGADALGEVSVPPLPGPVLVVVLDELPLSTLLRSDGTINAQRYPSFDRLAATATWYRNASSPLNSTDQAVPAMLTSVVPDEPRLPTYDAQPRNLMALFGTAAPVERYEAFTDMCPPTACGRQDPQPLRRALEDAVTVYGHRVLPPSLRADLAPIDDAWGGFGEAVGAAAPAAGSASATSPSSSGPLTKYRDLPASERAAVTQANRLLEQVDAIDGTPMLHFVHVVFPHSPWFATPWGTTLMPPMPDWVEDPDAPGFEESALLRYQRHALQVGASDVALGEAMDRLQARGLWDATTVVVTADHGTSTIPPDLGRVATEANRDEVYRVPLFLKEAGQREGTVVDDVAMTIDILPTLIDLFDIQTDWQLDGHSLLDGSEPTRRPEVSSSLSPLLAVVERHEADFPHGLDWTALAAIGEHGGLVGTPLADLEVGLRSTLQWEAVTEGSFAALPNERGEVPQIVVGRITVPDGTPPPALVIVANGTVAGVTGGTKPSGDRWWFHSLLGPYLVGGANEIDAYEVTREGGRAVLHLLE